MQNEGRTGGGLPSAARCNGRGPLAWGMQEAPRDLLAICSSSVSVLARLLQIRRLILTTLCPLFAGTLSNKACNAIFWSPLGHHIVMAGLKNLNGQLEFFSVDEFDTLATAEHFMATDVEWDPTGRYVATGVTSIQQMENGFNLWSFNGKLIYTHPKDRCAPRLIRVGVCTCTASRHGPGGQLQLCLGAGTIA